MNAGTVTIMLEPELNEWINAEAERAGQTREEYVLAMLSQRHALAREAASGDPIRLRVRSAAEAAGWKADEEKA
jgi:hypothetical protein